MTLSYSVGKASVVFTSLSLLRSVLSALVLPVLVVVLARDEFGLIVLLTPLWWIAQSLFTLGANEGLARLCAHTNPGTPVAVLQTCLLALLMGGLTTALLSASSEAVLGIPFEAAIAWAMVVAVGQTVVSTTVGVLRATQDLPGATATLAIATIAPPVTGVAMVLASPAPSASTYLFGMAAASIAAGSVGLTRIVAAGPLKFRAGTQLARSAVRLGVPLLPSLLGALVVDAGLRRIALHFGSLADLAVLGVALAVIGVLTTVVKSIFLAWSPKFFSNTYQHPEGVLVSFSERLLALSGCLQAATVLLLASAAPLIERLDLPPGDVLQVTAIGSAAAVCAIPVMAAAHLGLHRESTVRLALPVAVGNVSALVVTWWIVAATSWKAASTALTIASIVTLALMSAFRAGVALNARILLLLGSSLTLAGAATLFIDLVPLWALAGSAGAAVLGYALLARSRSPVAEASIGA